MGYEYFIARRTFKSVVQGKKVSRPIIRISVISIILALVVNLVTLAVVRGFQQEVRRKVSGFGSHISLMNAGEQSIFESEPMRVNKMLEKSVHKNQGIRSITPVAYKPLLFQSDKQEIRYKLANGKDTVELKQDVYGGIIKGVDGTYDWGFFRENLVDGRLPEFSAKQVSNEILISKKLADKLGFKSGQEVSAFFVRQAPVKRKFIVAGIYETGLEEFDNKTVLGDLQLVQELNDWGIKASIEVEDSTYLGNLIIKASITGGNGNYRCDWGKGFEKYTRFAICPDKDTVIRLIASDYWSDIKADPTESTLADTAYLKIQVRGTAYSSCDFGKDKEGNLNRNYIDSAGFIFNLAGNGKGLRIESIPGTGSFTSYISGYEVQVGQWDQLEEIHKKLKRQIEFKPTEFDEILQVRSIKDAEQDIFVWLDFLDINVIIILSLMILIGIINMGSALLVLIIIRTNFIGILKALGASNWKIRKIFIIHAGRLILRGMIWGNTIGLLICYLQSRFAILPLNPEVYYLNKVPISLSINHWLLLNAGTLTVCLLALIVPSIVITRILPAKAIRFH